MFNNKKIKDLQEDLDGVRSSIKFIKDKVNGLVRAFNTIEPLKGQITKGQSNIALLTKIADEHTNHLKAIDLALKVLHTPKKKVSKKIVKKVTKK